MRIQFTFLMVFLLVSVAWSQTFEVTDEQGNPLAFVSVLIDDHVDQGMITDIDGKFSLPANHAIQFLSFRYVGYETLRVATASMKPGQSIRLSAAAYNLAEAVVIAGENPANLIIRKAVKRRALHDPEQMRSYRCRIYNKLKGDFFSPDEAKIGKEKTGKIAQLLDSIMQQQAVDLLEANKDKHVFLMESLVERSFLSPRHLLERILNNRISGFRSPSFSALVHSLQPFSFYKDYLDILDQEFLNPLSKSSEEQYFFEIKDTLINGQDSIFEIAFRPRKGKIFVGLQGVLQIHSDRYALQSIRAKPADPGALQLNLEQLYKRQNGQWFPYQLNIEMEANKYPSQHLGTRFSGRSYIDQVEINPPLRLRDFPLDGIELVKGSASRADTLWEKIRLEPLSSKELQTYSFLDSIGERKKVDRVLKIMDALFQGRYPLGIVDWDLTKAVKSNFFEGFRPGLRLVTNDRLSEWIRFSAYAGYGFKDKDWKYHGEIEWDVAPRREGRFNAYFKKDILEPARFEIDQPNELLTSRVYSSRADVLSKMGISFGGYFLPYTYTSVQLEHQRFEPQYDYYFKEEIFRDSVFRMTELTGKLRYAFGEKFTEAFGTRIRERSNFPSLLVEYRQGLKQWNGDFAYKQLLGTLEGNLLLDRMGTMDFAILVGKVWGDVPLTKLYSTTGLGNNFGLLIDELGFRTMRPYEFLSDRYAFLFVKYELGNLLGRKKLFRPLFSIEHNMGIGTLEKPEHHDLIEFSTLEDGYIESGLVIDNIISLNYFSLGYAGLGFGAFYRYGANALPIQKDNWSFKVTISFDFL